MNDVLVLRNVQQGTREILKTLGMKISAFEICGALYGGDVLKLGYTLRCCFVRRTCPASTSLFCTVFQNHSSQRNKMLSCQ